MCCLNVRPDQINHTRNYSTVITNSEYNIISNMKLTVTKHYLPILLWKINKLALNYNNINIITNLDNRISSARLSICFGVSFSCMPTFTYDTSHFISHVAWSKRNFQSGTLKTSSDTWIEIRDNNNPFEMSNRLTMPCPYSITKYDAT